MYTEHFLYSLPRAHVPLVASVTDKRERHAIWISTNDFLLHFLLPALYYTIDFVLLKHSEGVSIVTAKTVVSRKKASSESTKKVAVHTDDHLLRAAINYIRTYGGKEFCILIIDIKSNSHQEVPLPAKKIALRQEFVEIAKEGISLDSPINDNDENTLCDTLVSEMLTPEEVAEKSSSARKINQILQHAPLSPREKGALVRHFGLCGCTPISYIKIGELYGISRAAAQQTVVRAVRKLARILKRAELTEDCFLS